MLFAIASADAHLCVLTMGCKLGGSICLFALGQLSAGTTLEPEPVPEPAPEPESAAHPAAGAEHGAEDDPSPADPPTAA